MGLPYGCKSGVCGSCKARVLKGNVAHTQTASLALSDAERAEGITLMCCTSARSNLSLEVKEVQGSKDYPVKIMPARIQEMRQVASDVIVLRLKLPANEPFRYRPGQYIDILLKDGQRRSFSIANPSKAGEPLELHIRKVEGGQFTTHVFSGMKERDIVRIEGPLGSFFLREDSVAPIILLAGGTGFAPIKAIVEAAIESQLSRPMHLYWGANRPEGLYLDALANEWVKSLPWFQYTPVVSAATGQDAWTGRSGLVHHALLEDYPDLADHQVYACGAPAMIDAARADLVKLRALHAEAFFADAFSFSTAPV